MTLSNDLYMMCNLKFWTVFSANLCFIVDSELYNIQVL